MHAANPFTQPCEVPFGAVSLLKSATPFGIDKKHAVFGVAPHIQIDIYAALVSLQVLGSIDTLCREASAVIFSFKEPTPAWRG
jgi:hypothetical protein